MKDLTTSIYTFENLIQGSFLYVDKTEHVWQLIRPAKEMYFLSRPRRFGKSLLLSTLKAVFQGRKELFKGLALYDKPYDWKPYPIIHLDFANESMKSATGLEEFLQDDLDNIAREYRLALRGQSLAKRFENLINDMANASQAGQVVVLVDEYDKPILGNIANTEHCAAILRVLKTEHRSGDNVFHIHNDFYELVVIRKGDGLHTIGKNLPTRIFSGRVLLVPPGSAHSYSQYTSISLINYIFTPSFLESIHDEIKDIPGYQLLFERDDSQEEYLSPLLLENQHLVGLTVLVDEMMSEQLSPSPGFALLLKAQFAVSLICILRNIKNKASNSTGALRMLGLLDFLQAHYARRLSLSQMAGMTNMSVASLCRHF